MRLRVAACQWQASSNDRVGRRDGSVRTKPDPEVFFLAAKLLSIEPEKCLVVEDAEAGIEAGNAGVMKTAAYGAAAGCKKADLTLRTFSDLLQI